MGLLSKLTTSTGTTVTKYLEHGYVTKHIQYPSTSKMAKMGLDNVVITKGKNSLAYDIYQGSTGRRFFLGSAEGAEKKDLIAFLKKSIAERKRAFGI